MTNPYEIKTVYTIIDRRTGEVAQTYRPEAPLHEVQDDAREFWNNAHREFSLSSGAYIALLRAALLDGGPRPRSFSVSVEPARDGLEGYLLTVESDDPLTLERFAAWLRESVREGAV